MMIANPDLARRRLRSPRRAETAALATLLFAGLALELAPARAQVEIPDAAAASPSARPVRPKAKPAPSPAKPEATPADPPSPPSSAAPAGAASGAAKVDAKALVQSGVKLLKQKDYLGALAVFRDAYQRFPSVKLLLNIGTTLKLLGRNAEAANAYQRYLDDPDADPARVSEVGDVLSTLDRVLGRLQLGTPNDASSDAASEASGEAAIDATTEIAINGGEPMPLSQARLVRVDPGEYRIAARREGFTPVELSGRVAAGELALVQLRLTPLPRAAPLPSPGAAPEDDGLAAGAGALRRGATAGPARRSRLGLMLRGHFHLSPAGAAALVGPTVDLTDRIEVNAGALLGRFRGGYLGGSFAVLPGRLRPIAAAGLLVVSDDGARFAVRGAVGLEVVVSRNLSLFTELGGEHLFNPPMTVFANAFVPSAGVLGRL